MTPTQSAADYFKHLDALELLGWDTVLSHGEWRLFVRLLRLGNRIGYTTPIIVPYTVMAGWLGHGTRQAERLRDGLATHGLVVVTHGHRDMPGKPARCASMRINLDRLHGGPHTDDISDAGSTPTDDISDVGIAGTDDISDAGQVADRRHICRGMDTTYPHSLQNTHSSAREADAEQSIELTNRLHQHLASPEVGGPSWGFATHEGMREQVARLVASGMTYEDIEAACVKATADAASAPRSWKFYQSVLDVTYRDRTRPKPVNGGKPFNDRGFVNKHTDHARQSALAKASRDRYAAEMAAKEAAE